jgi:pilus assembly protein CpaF
VSKGINTVWALLHDLQSKKGITEIVINDPKKVFVEREGQFIQLNIQLRKADIWDFAKEVAAYNRKRIDTENPIVDGNLPDGSRINIIADPFANGSPAITIRKYLPFIKSFDKSPGIFGLGASWIELMKAMVKARMNVMVSGGTGVGKTTLLNLLLAEISPMERVISIEDTLELSLNMPNLVRLEAAQREDGSHMSLQDLVKNTLRMRPDRIIIGEVRGGEFFDLLQAMNTGHEGSMSSVHANDPAQCLGRLENLFLMSGHDLPYHVVRKQMTQGIDFIIQVGRSREGERIITQIMEITGMEGNNILSQNLAVYEDGKLGGTGISAKNMERLHRDGGLELDFFNRDVVYLNRNRNKNKRTA